jgi:uncharacterized LabA/DUF88 family protein
MDRYAVLVDAGYFYAAAAQAITQEPTARRRVSLQAPDTFIKSLLEKAAHVALAGDAPALHLLRVYWYDALLTPRLTLEQSTIAHLPGVKIRLGTVNAEGKQKGVDSLIVTDLVELARNRAVSDAILVSGDEDLRIAVQIAQTYGIRVHVLAVGDPAKNVNPALRMEADSVESLDAQWLGRHVAVAPEPNRAGPVVAVTGLLGVPGASSGKVSGITLDQAAERTGADLLAKGGEGAARSLNTHFASSTTVPAEYDRKLVACTAALLERPLTPDEKRHIRGIFVRQVRAQKSSSGAPT